MGLSCSEAVGETGEAVREALAGTWQQISPESDQDGFWATDIMTVCKYHYANEHLNMPMGYHLIIWL